MQTTLYMLKRNTEALASLERALELDPKSANAWTGKVTVLEKLGRTSEAAAARSQRDLALGTKPSVEDHLRDRARLSPPPPSDGPKGR